MKLVLSLFTFASQFFVKNILTKMQMTDELKIYFCFLFSFYLHHASGRMNVKRERERVI